LRESLRSGKTYPAPHDKSAIWSQNAIGTERAETLGSSKNHRENNAVWSKQKDEFATPQHPEPVRASAPQPSAPPSPAQAPASVHASASTASIGASMRIKGEIRSREELLVDGQVEGLIESESLLTVGPNGKVKANIKAREVVIYGSVNGDVEVSGKIAIREQGSLVGNIKSAGIGIDDGAYFKGSIDIVRPEPVRHAKGTVVTEAAAVAQ
jgi:cytoskeletal protein CcmA (bactofilin family)